MLFRRRKQPISPCGHDIQDVSDKQPKTVSSCRPFPYTTTARLLRNQRAPRPRRPAAGEKKQRPPKKLPLQRRQAQPTHKPSREPRRRCRCPQGRHKHPWRQHLCSRRRRSPCDRRRDLRRPRRARFRHLPERAAAVFHRLPRRARSSCRRLLPPRQQRPCRTPGK